ncbi:transposase [Microbulbifer sediminum]|uniref:transposase n=1 Tax=Microbulbifer sediminum TaxID=2904250 RepID=UPI001F374ACE|nr:transposase [Microbulbifer sediminum]
MARLPRLGPAEIPQHVIQRGNNRQVCFCSEQDMLAYAGWLKQYAKEFDIQVHAWVLMTNHVHLLVTPQSDQGVSRLMQALGRIYLRYFNREYRRSGTLWEGRYKSCLVQSGDYLLQCYRYIELNPVRAGMVSDPGEYFWSSYGCNGLGRSSSLLIPHMQYLALDRYPKQRQECYRALFRHALDAPALHKIRGALSRGLALGNDRFKAQIEGQFARRVTQAPLGRPRIALP